MEVGVQVVQRWILARLRNRRFFSLAELNQAIRELVDQLNDRPMRGWGTTRRALSEQIDRPALRELPPAPYEYADWKRCRVNLDYHVEIDKHFYSVPFRLLREEVEARITAKTVEIFHRGKLVAAHLRSLRPNRSTTLADHMPSSHRRYRDWTHERILREAASIGKPVLGPAQPDPWDTAALVDPRVEEPGGCARARIRSRGSAPASAFSGWRRAMTPSGWMAPVPGHWRWAPAHTVRSRRS